MRRFRAHVQALILGVLGFAAILAGGCRGCGTVKGTGGQVHGFVYTDIPDTASPQGKRKGFVPGVTVFLKNSSTSAESPKVVTDIRGWYAIPHMPAGKYDLCWQADGYVSGCTPRNQRITIKSSTVTPGLLSIMPQAPALFGRALFPGNAPCLAQDPFFGLNSVTNVTLIDGSGNAVHPPVLANSIGDFIIPATPASGQLRVRAECDGLTAEAPLPTAGSAAPLRLEFPNVSPRILSLMVGRGSRSVRTAEPGSTVPVTVKVQDAAKRRLHYQWFPSVPSPTFVSKDSATVVWKLASARALNTLYVLVTDEKGGHSIGQVNVFGGGPEVIFSGTVVEAGGSVLSGATVSINGQSTATNAQGYFFIQLATGSSQYVLNISKNGYALFSKILGGAVVGATYSLIKSQTITVDPTHDIDVTQSLPGQSSAGAEIRIPANSLVNAQGKPPSSSLSVCISTIDLHDPVGRLPGNFGGRSTGGQGVRLSPYGGVDIQIRDNAGGVYNLAPGKTATLRIPADPAALAVKAPPASLPFYFYNPQTGLWGQQGSAKFTERFYEGEIPHLSSINIAFASSNAACIALNIDPGTVNTPFLLNVAFADSTGAGHSSTTEIDPLSPPDAIAELPPTEPITLQVGTLQLGAGVAITSSPTGLVRSNNVTTVTCGAPCGVSSGNFVTIFGSTSVGGTSFDATNVVATSLSPTTFTFPQTAPNDTGGGGTVYPGVELSVQTVNSGAATPGPANPNPAPASCNAVADVAVAPTNALGYGPLSASVGFLDYYGLDDDVTASAYYSVIDPQASQSTALGTVSSSGTTVTGSGTSFTTYFQNGEIISAGSQVRTVTSVTNNTSLVVSSPFSPALSGASYQEIGVKNTLANFKSQNGWTGADTASATYFNSNDLDFGRSMHMYKSGSNIFYYVTNYPNIEAARLQTGAIATVAMEYSPSPSVGSPFTKFYVFNGAGDRINAANLDNRGAKFVPRLCIICHGGTPATGADTSVVSAMQASGGNFDARFIGFDLASYAYSGFAAAFGRSSQEDAFRQLNQGVLESTNPSAAQQELLPGWYSQGGGSINTSVTSATVAAGPTGLVRSGNVVTVNCTSACGVANGAVIAIFGSTPTGTTVFDTPSVVATSAGPSATGFTFPQPAANDSGGGGTVYVGVEYDAFVPSKWSSSTPVSGDGTTTTPITVAPNTLYTVVQRTSCRTCHVDRDPPLDWNTFDGGVSNPIGSTNAGFRQYGPLIGPDVCDDRFMPHAKVTYVNFWMSSTSLSNPNRAQDLLGAGLDYVDSTIPCPLE